MKLRFFILVITPICALLLAFASDDPFFTITEKDVRLNIPRGFPKPVYDFKNNKLSPSVFTLGRTLFYDPKLSKDQSTSCGTCHQRIAAFAHIDHRLSHGIYARIGTRNVPALQNLIWKDSYMWDGGVNHLEVQPVNPITNPIEMDETLPGVLLKLRADSNYVRLFKNAYGDTGISSERLLKALAQFTGLMISGNSRYDLYLAGREKLNEAEIRGLKVFRARCASCHREPLFTDNSYCSNGIPADSLLDDAGRFLVTGLAGDKYKFKVPGLRNIVMTYPYMHDGRFRNLQEVMDHYAALDGNQKSGDKRMLNISLDAGNKSDLIAFLGTLTDKTFLYDRRFAEPPLR